MSILQSTPLNDVWDLLKVRRQRPPRAPSAATEPDDVWNALQGPARLADHEPQYRLLRAALDTGWRVEEPVYLRTRWSDDGPRVYHFILRRDGASPRLLSVPQSAEVDRFVRDEGLRLLK